MCTEPGCPNPLPCAEHQRAPWTKRTPTRRTSAARWQRLRRRVLARDERRCQTCGEPGDQVDHVTPVAEGGSDDATNLATICDRCHKLKSEAEKQRGLARWRAAGAPPR